VKTFQQRLFTAELLKSQPSTGLGFWFCGALLALSDCLAFSTVRKRRCRSQFICSVEWSFLWSSWSMMRKESWSPCLCTALCQRPFERFVMPLFESRSVTPVRRRLSSVLLAAAMTVGLVAVTSHSVSAEFDTVTSITPSNPAANSNRANDVSCVSTTFCMSVIEGRQTSNYSDPATTFLTKWDGGVWSLVPTSGWPTNFRPNDIACPTTSVCLVAGGVDVFENMNLSTTSCCGTARQSVR
jgi:hypothetical protein